jgi:hypothetical protein
VNKKHMVLRVRIIFMVFAATISIVGVWTNIKMVTWFGAILWILSSIVNVIYSVKNSGVECNLSRNSNVHQKKKGI